jgi:hypothetical protein
MKLDRELAVIGIGYSEVTGETWTCRVEVLAALNFDDKCRCEYQCYTILSMYI